MEHDDKVYRALEGYFIELEKKLEPKLHEMYMCLTMVTLTAAEKAGIDVSYHRRIYESMVTQASLDPENLHRVTDRLVDRLLDEYHSAQHMSDITRIP